MLDLEEHRLTFVPPTIHYIRDFVTPEEAEYLWDRIYSSPKPKWTQLGNRRLQNWGGQVFKKGFLRTDDIPQWLKVYTNKISELGVFGGKKANHCLINEYLPNQGIMPHHDGPAYFPCVATISLGSPTLIDYYKPIDHTTENAAIDSRYLFSLYLEPRSLLVVRDDMYNVQMHGIKDAYVDMITEKVLNYEMHGLTLNEEIKRTTRISITVRRVNDEKPVFNNKLLKNIRNV